MVGMKQAEMTGDGEEKVVVPWRQVGELVAKHLRHFGGVRVCSSDASLSDLWQNF